MKKRLLSKTSIMAIVLLMACSESLLDKQNPNGGTPESFYANELQLTQGINSVYAIAQGFGLVAREWFFVHDLRSDEMATGGGQLEVPRSQLLTGVHTPGNAVAQNVWEGFFRTILRANEVIDGSANTKDTPPATIKRIVGEAKFLRAWAYSDLVLLWGAVPLHTKVAQSLDEASKPRTSVDEVYAFIIKDLSDIQADLPLSYKGENVGRVTQGAAQALLARVLMAKGDFAGAKTELLKIYNAKTYSLMDSYSDNYLEETGFNKESIFEIGFGNSNMNWSGPDGNVGNGDGINEGNSRTQEYSAIGWRNLVPSDGLLAEFETTGGGDAKTDPRFGFSFYRIGDKFNNGASTLTDDKVQGTLSNYPPAPQKISWRKYSALYKNAETFYTGPMNMRIIRYAEVLANLAECENEVGTGAQALLYLKEIRNRASVQMPAYPTAKFPCNSKAEIFKAIQHERRVEFAGEQLRNRDILRWRKNGKLVAEPIAYFKENKFELLPLPQTEFSTNAKLTSSDQNPGY
jgi:starch-binding outer membrane protein, SusD/RagB family